jgi:hypothetical protein
MEDPLFSRMWHEIAARPDGPFAFRFYLQPLMACALAIRDGIKDARSGRPAYFWSLFSEPRRRHEHMRECWQATKRVFLLAIGLDVIYQLVVLKGLRPVEGLVVAVALAIVPYVLVRGPANRIARRIVRRRPAPPRGHAV